MGQSTIEAAILLPTLMLLLGIVLQPACVLYTRTAMRHAAAEGLRAASTATSLDSCESFVLRRLRSVPDVAMFHVGGRDGWDVSVETDGDTPIVAVEIEGRLRPLPIVGLVFAAFGETDEGDLVLRERVEEASRASWVEGDYEEWTEVWE